MAIKNLTKQYLCETLIAMCEEQPLSSITVTALIKRAGVARQTFYNNFRDINDIINYIPRTFMLLAGFDGYTPEATLKAYRYATRHKGFFSALAKHSGQNSFRDEFITFCQELMYRQFLPDNLSADERFRRKLALDVYTIGVVDHFLKWCEGGLEWPYEVVAQVHSEAAPAFILDQAQTKPVNE